MWISTISDHGVATESEQSLPPTSIQRRVDRAPALAHYVPDLSRSRRLAKQPPRKRCVTGVVKRQSVKNCSEKEWSRIFASWNQLDEWLRQVDRLRWAA